MPYTYEYPRPMLTVDCVVFGFDNNDRDLKILFIKRKNEPFKDCWAIPGGFVDQGEALEMAAIRELQEETNLTDIYLEQLYTFGQPNRDTRGRVVTVAYYALIKMSNYEPKAASDAKELAWFSVNELPDLAFDHSEIVSLALNRIRGKIRYQPIGFNLLEEKFPLSELRRLYEVILNKTLEKRNFRKKILKMGILSPLDEVQKGVPHRAARLYQFNETVYTEKAEKGFNFEL